jgi:RNA polymerase sigma-70 factor (ECF subfamily)
MTDGLTGEMHDGARAAWVRFIDAVEPLRPTLARYCRRLTGDVWDAEDLIHDTLLRSFGLLGSVHYELRNPRAYLLRIATNLWIDAQRRRILEAAVLGDAAVARTASAAPATQEAAADVRPAGEALLRYLAPQERAAVLLKDVFDMSLEETASVLGTTIGAVKAALHRGRARLSDVEQAAGRPTPSITVIDRFVALYHARDVDGLLALMLDGAAVEMSGVNNEFGREGFARPHGWFFHTVIGIGGMDAPRVSRWERRAFHSEPIVVQLTSIGGREQLTSALRFETEGDRVARVQCYTFCPDAVREVGGVLSLELGPVFYSFPPFEAAWAPGGAFMPGTRS